MQNKIIDWLYFTPIHVMIEWKDKERKVNVILYSYLILKKMNERITDS